MPSVVGQITKGATFDKLIDATHVAGTAHRLLYTGADGVVNELAYGTSGQHLKSEGASSAPTWETPSAGGVDTSGIPVTLDYARFTDADTIEGRSYAEVRSDLNVADGANAYTHPNHSGDVTSVADGAQTIVADAVTYNKMRDTSSTDVLLGRETAGGGTIEEIACTAAGRALIDDVDAGAQRTTLGAAAAADVLLKDGSVALTADWAAGAFDIRLDQCGLRDTGLNHHLMLKCGSDLVADRPLTFVTGDATRTITFTGNPTLDDWFDQDVKRGTSPQFTADDFSDGGGNAIVTTTQETNWDTHLSSDGSSHTFIDQDVTSGSSPTLDSTSITGPGITSGADPGHTHTGASLSSIDISADTNLAVTSPIVLTDDTLSLATITTSHVEDELKSHDKIEYIKSPTDSDDYPIFYTKKAITITEVRGVTDVGTLTFQLKWRPWATMFSAAGTNILSASLVANTTGVTTTSFADATIPAGSVIAYVASAESANPVELAIPITFTVD